MYYQATLRAKITHIATKRQALMPLSFVDDMRRAALDQGRWYLALCELRSAQVKDKCTPLRARLLDRWEEFGRTLNLPEEVVLRAALRAGQAHLCHALSCQYNLTKAPNALKKCQGCGEVYYCSKICQKR